MTGQIGKSYHWGQQYHLLNQVNIFEQAEQCYKQVGLDIHLDIANYAMHEGYVFLTPDFMLWGKPVRRDGGLPHAQWKVAEPDAFYVRFAVGKGCLDKFLSLTSLCRLPYIGWSRYLKNKPLRYYKTEHLLRGI
jgi:hypothetical protein